MKRRLKVFSFCFSSSYFPSGSDEKEIERNHVLTAVPAAFIGSDEKEIESSAVLGLKLSTLL